MPTPTGVTTLLAVRDACKSESDNVGEAFVADAEWDVFIQRSYAELYGLIVTEFGNDYFVQSPNSGYQFTTDGINQLFNLPDGVSPSFAGASAFFKLLGVDLRVSAPNQWVSLHPFPFAERNRYSLGNNNIPMAGQVIRLLYVPRLVVPTADSDLLDGVNGWTEYIVVDACIKAMGKEESDVSPLFARKQALIDRLNSEVENRDAGFPAVIADTRGRGGVGMRYRLNGNQLWLIGGSTLQPGWGDFSWDDGFYGNGAF